MRDEGKALRNRLAGAGCKPPQAALVKSPGRERYGKGTARSCQVRNGKTNASEPLMTRRKRRDDVKTRGSRYSGISSGGIRFLPERRPALRWRESVSGSSV